MSCLYPNLTPTGRYRKGCRCDDCRAHNAARCQKLQRARCERSEQAPHGTVGAYTNWGCRCEPCTSAHNARCRAYYQSRKKAKA